MAGQHGERSVPLVPSKVKNSELSGLGGRGGGVSWLLSVEAMVSPSARRRSRTMTSLFTAAAVIVGHSSPTVATHAYDYAVHWEQNPGGGLNRWVPYKHRPANGVFADWYQHVMIHYYEADNRWRPYRVYGSDPAKIIAKSYWDAAIWYGDTKAQTTAPADHRHFIEVNHIFNERELTTSSEIHTVMCHEIGHAGGLDHNPSKSSCIYKNHFLAAQDFTEHDSDEIKWLHGHSD